MKINHSGILTDDSGKIIHTLPALFLDILNRFKAFRGPKGEKFGNTFILELLMGKFSEAYQAYLISEAAKDQAISDLQAANSNANSGSTTPKGRVLDSADLTSIDEFIDRNVEPKVQIPAPPPIGGT